MSNDIWRHMKKERQREGEQNRAQAQSDFKEAQRIASKAGMILIRHDGAHYSLRWRRWLINIYPGNHRLYVPREFIQKGQPYLSIKADWSLVDVVNTAIVQWVKLPAKDPSLVCAICGVQATGVSDMSGALVCDCPDCHDAAFENYIYGDDAREEAHG